MVSFSVPVKGIRPSFQFCVHQMGVLFAGSRLVFRAALDQLKQVFNRRSATSYGSGGRRVPSGALLRINSVDSALPFFP